MKYPCNLIQDLLPLYHDKVCSKESMQMIENHLAECTVCNEFYTALCEADKAVTAFPDENELKKAASFRAVKKKILWKQVLAVILSLSLWSLLAFGVVKFLTCSVDSVEYEDNVTVFMAEGNLIGRLQGSRAERLRIKRVEILEEGEMNTYLFFHISDTKWDNMTTKKDIFSEYVLCYADKGAEQVDAVYYYGGDYAGIETLSQEELQKVKDASVLLWSK